MKAKLAAWILMVALTMIATLAGRAETAAGPGIQNLRFYAGISYSGTAGVAYELQYTTNLQNPGGWITLTNVILDTNRLFLVDLDSPLSAKRFYRLHEVSAAAPSAASQAEARAVLAAGATGDGRQSILSAAALTSDWGPLIDPDHDCKLGLTNGTITVAVPGTAHDFAAELKRWNAPRILTNIEGDFILEVKVGGEFRPGEGSTIEGRRPYHGAGLLLVQDATNHLSLQRGAVLIGDRMRHYANFELRHGPESEVSNYEFEIEDKDISLRLARSGNKVLAMTSQDGVNWRAFNPLTVDFPSALKVGVEVISSSETPLAVTFKGLALYRGAQGSDVSGK